jgi:hypothetical protein
MKDERFSGRDMIHLAFFQNQDAPDIATVIVVAAVGIVLVVTVLLLLNLGKDFGDLAQTQALLTTGEPAQAKILRMWDTGTTLNDDPKVGLLLEVYSPNRTPYQVETKCYVSRLKISQVQPGNVVAVKIDRQDASKIALDLA